MTEKMFNLAKLATVILLAYWLLLFVGTHIPLDNFDLPTSDKILHFLAYMGLSFLLASTVALRRHCSLSTYAWLLGIIAVYGVLDELIQHPIPGRTADVHDWVADLAGGIVGLLIHALVWSTVRSVRWKTKTAQTEEATA